MSIEQAFVEITPEIDPTSFEAAVDGAMGNVESRAEEASNALESAFDSAADDAGAALEGIDPEFDGVSSGAEAAASDVEAAFDEAASGADATLGEIDGDGFEGAAAGAEAAGSEVESAFDSAADAADAALSSVEGDFESTVGAAEAAGDGVSSAFDSAADEAGSALGSIEGDFSSVEGEADGAASSIASAMESAADQAGSALGSVSGDFSGAVSGAEGASSSIEGAIAGAAAAAVASLESVDPNFSNTTSAAESAASDTTAAFDGVGEDISDEFDEASSGASNLQSQVRNLVGAVVSLAVLRTATLDAERFNSAVAATDQILQATGASAGLLRTDLMAMAEELEFELGIDVTDLIEAQNLLLTFRNVGSDVFEETITLAADLSVVLGTDLQGSVLQLGKALNDPVLGMSALSRAGVTFTEAQREQARALVETGDLLGAQTIILDELRGQVGGTAAATRDSTAVISNGLAGLRRELGTPIIAAIDDNLDGIMRIIESMGPAAESLGQLGGATVELLVAMEPIITTVAEAIGAIPDPVLAFASAMLIANRAMRLGVPLMARLTRLRFSPTAAGIAAVAAALALMGEGSFEVENTASAAERAVQDLASGVDNELVNALVRGHDWIQDSTEVLGLFRVNWTSFDESARGAANNFEESIGNMDTALAGLVSGGGMEQAEDAVQALAEELGIGGDELDAWVQENLPEYNDALIAAELQARATEEAIKEFGAATEETGQALDNFNTEQTASSLIDLAGALTESTDQAGDFQAVSQSLGVDLEQLRDNIVPGLTEEFDTFASDLSSAMPGMADVVSGAFERMGESQENLSFENVQESLDETLETARQFSDDVAALVDAGLINMAQLAIEGGPEVAAALVSGPEAAKGEMEIALAELNTIIQEQTLQTAADAAVVSFFVGQALSDGTLDGIELLPENLQTVITDAVGRFAEVETGPARELGGRARSSLNAGWSPVVQDLINSANEAVPGAISSGAEAVNTAATGLGRGARQKTDQAWSPIVQDILDTAQTQIPGAIRSNAGRAAETGREYGRGARNATRSGFSPVVDDILSTAQTGIPDSIARGERNAERAGRGVGNSAEGGVESGFSGVVAGVGARADRAVNALGNRRATMRNRGSSVGGAGGEGVESGLRGSERGIDGAARGVVSSAISAAQGATGGASSIGAAIGAGVSSGLGSSSVIGSIIARARALVSAALAAARSAAQTGSPSRLFRREIGEQLGMGVALGIEDTVGPVADSMAALIDSAAAVPLETPAISTAIGRDVANVGGGGGTRLAPADLDRLAQLIAQAMPSTILLQAGSEQALARMVRNGDVQLESIDPTWRRDG